MCHAVYLYTVYLGTLTLFTSFYLFDLFILNAFLQKQVMCKMSVVRNELKVRLLSLENFVVDCAGFL